MRHWVFYQTHTITVVTYGAKKPTEEFGKNSPH